MTTSTQKHFSKAATLNNLSRQIKDRQLGIVDVDLEDHLNLQALSHLPQSATLKNVLAAVKNDGLAEAYLRGSFSSGDADDYSDIDLFLVVDPSHLEKTFLQFIDYAKSHYEILSICHDKLVADYGGVGFMAILKDKVNSRVTQFDLYFCQTGGYPKTPLVNSPRIYSRNPDYSVFCEKEPQTRDADAQKLMAHVVPPLDKTTNDARHELNDLAIAAFIMSKHLKRGQIARARNDDHHAVQLCANLFKQAIGYTSHQTPLYFADRLVETCISSGSPVQQKIGSILKNICANSPSLKQIGDITLFIRQMIVSFYPALEEEFRPILNELEISANPRLADANVIRIAQPGNREYKVS